MGSLEHEILDAARYLRSVRPLDPSELLEYTTTETTVDQVREVLRNHAVELGLVEGDDGLFRPASKEQLAGPIDPIEAIPPDLSAFIEERLAGEHGSAWASGERGAAIRDRIRDLKKRYLVGGSIDYDRLDADAYLLYHFPRSYAATWYTFGELLEAGLLNRTLRVLDIGAGVGAHLAAIDDLTPDDTLVEYVAVEPSPLVEHLRALSTRRLGRNTHVSVHQVPIEELPLEREFDVLLLGNLLSEVSEPIELAHRSLEFLTSSGSWVAIAPADPRTSVQLRAVERSLEESMTVFSPTIRLWPGYQPTDDCWSFVEWPDLSVPPFQQRLREEAEDDGDAFVNTEIRYSYSIMRGDGLRRYELDASETDSLLLARAPSVIGERVDVIVVKLSGDLATDGNPVYRVGDGSQTEDCFGTHVSLTEMNHSLQEAPYGAVLRFERALVLWNDDEAAINLVIDDETFVEQLAP